MGKSGMKIVNTVAFAATVLINALANLLPIGLGTTGEVSQKYGNLFTPAPVTFFIWGVIYLLLGGFIWYQWGKTAAAENARERVGIWFAVSCAMNIGWIFAWHFGNIGLSVIFILGLLMTLWLLAARLEESGESRMEAILVRGSFELYFGWIIAATIADFAAWLTKLEWNVFGLSQSFRTMIALMLATGIGIVVIESKKRILPVLGIIWAFIGILIRHISQDGEAGEYPVVIVTAIAGIVLMCADIALNLAGRMYRRKKERQTECFTGR